MKNLKSTKAITLVALIITIIVLLILAMVSIRLVMNGGIIGRAEKGKVAYSDEEIGEQLKLLYAEYQMGQYQTPVDIQSRLQKIFGNDNIQDVSVSDGKISAKIKVNGEFKKYEYDASTGKSGEKQPGIGDFITKDNYGDYIDLGQNIIGSSSTTDDWRILYNDKIAGKVYAILADYLPNSNPAVAESGLVTIDEGRSDVKSSTSRQDLIDKLNNITVWQSLIPEKLRSTCQVRGATTGEMILSSYNEKYNVNPPKKLTESVYFYVNNDSSKGIDSLYMPHPNTGAPAWCLGYWLSTNYYYDDDYVFIIRSTGNLSNRKYSDGSCSICPVVSLPSDLQVTSTTSNGVTVWSLAQ